MYLPLLCGHNVQALSILTHEPAQRREILQMLEGTAFLDDMTNYWIHTFWLLAPVRMIFFKLHRIVVLYSDLEKGRGPYSYRCQLNHGDCDWIGELGENSLSKNPIARAHYVPTNANKYYSYKVSNFRFCDVHFFQFFFWFSWSKGLKVFMRPWWWLTCLHLWWLKAFYQFSDWQLTSQVSWIHSFLQDHARTAWHGTTWHLHLIWHRSVWKYEWKCHELAKWFLGWIWWLSKQIIFKLLKQLF